jgi:hypothetical protein
MKLNNFIKLLLSAFVVISLASSCVKEGPMGLTGSAGKDGKDGADGKDANETCKACHNPAKVELLATQYEFSKHSYGEAAEEETGNVACAPCHESEGFKYVIKNNISTAFVAVNGVYANTYSATISTSYGPIDCSTCHSSLHSTYGSSDLPALTTVAAVPMTFFGGTKTINLPQNGGESHLCVRCHQPRPFTRTFGDKNVVDYSALKSSPSTIFFDGNNPTSTANVNTIRPGYRTHTHYGTAGAIFAGIGGVEFGTGYANSAHTTKASCQDCHMAPVSTSTNNGLSGGHSFVAKNNFNGCNTTNCHSASPITSATTSKYWKQTRDEIKTLLNQLAAKLTINGVDILNRNPTETNLWMGLTTNNYDGYLNIFDPSSNADGKLYNATMFQNPSPSSGWSQADKDFNASLPKITLTNAQMGAIINFQLCLRDYSLGIHNTAYTKTLLVNSIAALQ